MLKLSQLDRLDKVLAGCQPRGENWGSSHFGYWSEVVEMGCHRLDPLVELLGNVGCVRVCLHEFKVLIDVLLSLVAAGEMPSVVMVPPPRVHGWRCGGETLASHGNRCGA